MCNRYAYRGSVSQIRKLAEAMKRPLRTGAATDNFGGQEDIYLDQEAAILRNGEKGGLELVMALWVFPPILGENTPITNIRTSIANGNAT